MFDSAKVWHEALIYKLIRCKFPARLIHLIHSYLRNRLFMVRINNTLSVTLQILSGVLQGSALGPILFNIFFCDIPRMLYSNIASYADDTALYASAIHITILFRFLQEHVNLFTQWCTLWRVQLNENKTVAVFFSRSYKTPQRIIVNNTTIEWSFHCNYLGLTLDKRLTWKKHILNTKLKALRAIKGINILIKNINLNMFNKVLLYNACILPIMTYACPVWGYACTTNLNILSRFHNRNLRIIRKSHKFMRNTTIRRDLNTISFKKRIKNLAKKFFDNLNSLPNEIILEIPDYVATEPIHRKRPRYSLHLTDN